MKKRISATIDKETDEILDLIMNEGRYRNKSHAIEEIIKIFWEENHAKKK